MGLAKISHLLMLEKEVSAWQLGNLSRAAKRVQLTSTSSAPSAKCQFHVSWTDSYSRALLLASTVLGTMTESGKKRRPSWREVVSLPNFMLNWYMFFFLKHVLLGTSCQLFLY